VPEVCAAILKDKPKPPREHRAEISEGLEAVVLKCIEKDVKKRYSNVAELALALLSYGPPGSELSIERISKVLQKGARSAHSQRAGAVTIKSNPPPPPSDAPKAPAAEAPRPDLAATKPLRPSLVAALADTRMEQEKVEAAAPAAPSASATHSASSVSAWNAKPVAKGRSKVGVVLAVLLLLGGGGAGWVFFVRPQTIGHDVTGQEGVTTPPNVDPPSAVVPASPDPTEPQAVELNPPLEPTGAASAVGSIDPRTLPWGKPRPRPSASASASPSGAPSASPSSTASAQSTAAPSTTPSSAPSSKPK
jgi:serine/threonine-protein kinase